MLVCRVRSVGIPLAELIAAQQLDRETEISLEPVLIVSIEACLLRGPLAYCPAVWVVWFMMQPNGTEIEGVSSPQRLTYWQFSSCRVSLFPSDCIIN